MIGREVVTRVGGSVLLMLVLSCIFVVPLFPLPWHGLLYRALYTAIFVAAALTLEKSGRSILGIAIVVAVVEWIAYSLQLSTLNSVARLLNVGFFMFMVFAMIVQIIRVTDVDARVILAAVNGFLLLGLAASMAVAAISAVAPEAFGFSGGGSLTEFSEIIYYGFVTLTTVGYGDIVPREPYARSLATFIGVLGQMYVAIIIAMLVGKYASTRR